jgi:hypothetical protein
VILRIVMCASMLAPAASATAQANDVALVVSGSHAASTAEAFGTFVPISPDRRFDRALGEPPSDIAWLVTIDTDTGVVSVWRRRDRALLERRFQGDEDDGYALALVAAELLEVARSGSDPSAVGATLVVEPTVSEEEPERAEEIRPDAPAAEAIAPPLRLSATIGAGVEAWFSVERDTPWIVQPTIFVEVSGLARDGWILAAALTASGLGAWSRDTSELRGTYQRHDFGARFSFGGDVGPLRTRLMAHARAGASLVSGSAERAANGERGEAIRAGWFLGLALEARQPLIAGLEVWLELGMDGLPAPVRFLAFGETLLAEAPLRLTGDLGLAWRFE